MQQDIWCRAKKRESGTDYNTTDAWKSQNSTLNDCDAEPVLKEGVRSNYTSEDVVQNLQLWLKKTYGWDEPLHGWTGKVCAPTTSETSCTINIISALGLGPKLENY